MKERPILFSAPMVLALLAGKKTQTRRLVKHPRSTGAFVCADYGDGMWPFTSIDGESLLDADGNESPMACPYGVPGDQLWVRETWRAKELADGLDGVLYAADESFRGIENTTAAADLWIDAYDNGRHGDNWRPSIFMPRWASRLTLAVTEVRVERLQEISVEDALAEGIVHRTMNHPVVEYRQLWESINGSGSWDKNPFVWAVSFKAVRP